MNTFSLAVRAPLGRRPIDGYRTAPQPKEARMNLRIQYCSM